MRKCGGCVMDEVGRAVEAPLRGKDASAPPERAAPRIYYVHPLLAGNLDGWPAHLDRAAALGFDHVLSAPPFAADDLFLPDDFERLHPALGWSGDAASGLRRMA